MGKTVTIRFPKGKEGTRATMERLAAARGMNVSNFIVSAVEKEIASENVVISVKVSREVLEAFEAREVEAGGENANTVERLKRELAAFFDTNAGNIVEVSIS